MSRPIQISTDTRLFVMDLVRVSRIIERDIFWALVGALLAVVGGSFSAAFRDRSIPGCWQHYC